MQRIKNALPGLYVGLERTRSLATHERVPPLSLATSAAIDQMNRLKGLDMTAAYKGVTLAASAMMSQKSIFNDEVEPVRASQRERRNRGVGPKLLESEARSVIGWRPLGLDCPGVIRERRVVVDTVSLCDQVDDRVEYCPTRPIASKVHPRLKSWSVGRCGGGERERRWPSLRDA